MAGANTRLGTLPTAATLHHCLTQGHVAERQAELPSAPGLGG